MASPAQRGGGMIRGWCPTVHAPMPTGDGLLARVKPFGGRLSAERLVALAEAAASHGNGVLELTGRGNIQARGLHGPAAFAQAMVRAGLADADPVREARRNVVAIPPCDDALVAAAEATLANTPGLPAKFFVVVHDARIGVRGEWVGDAEALKRLLARGPLTPTLSHREREPTPVDLFEKSSSFGRGLGEGPAAPPPPPGHLLYLPFGQTTAAALAGLAGQTPELRTTPWRAFLSPSPVTGFAAAPSTITACAGSPACSSATTATRDDAARLQAMGFTRLHVSGCAKGCAHPAAATTLVGRNGRYDLVRHGRASDPPALTGLTLDQAAAAL